ncbi:MAG: lysylphosphatidylglycerol synthase transmembrane domain-containing protein [bacterium]
MSATIDTTAGSASPDAPRERARAGRGWREILAVALTIGLVWWLLRGLEWEKIRTFAANIRAELVVAAFAIYALSYVARALRWQVLLQRHDLSFRELYLITAAHIMYNNLLPSRIGELSYVVLLKQKKGLSAADGVVSLVVSRFLDFITLGLIFLLSVASFRGAHSVEAFRNLPLVAVSSVVLLSGGLVAMPALTSRFHRWLNRELASAPPESFRAKVERTAERMVETFERTAGTSSYLKAGLLSLVIWYAKFLSFTLMVHAMHDAGTASRMSFWGVVIGSTAAELTTITPFHGVAGMGTYEWAWKVVFHDVLGIDEQVSILTGFGVHVFLLFFSIVLGGLAYLGLRRITRRA